VNSVPEDRPQPMTGMGLPLSEQERIAASAGWREHRVEVFDTAAGRVIAKGHRPLRSPARHRVLSFLARLAGVPFLRAVPVHGGAQSQAVEIGRLQALRAAGAAVPEVLHVAADHFVMRWLGANQLANLLQQRHPAAFDLWLQGARALVSVHAAGQYLSQCFGRNMIVDDRAEPPRFAGMIDFEDDPLEVMTLPEAQVRDWLIYLQSTLWNLHVPAARIDAALDELMQTERPEVRALFAVAGARLGWLRCLPKKRGFGRDTIAVQAVAAAAHRWLLRSRGAARSTLSFPDMKSQDEANP